MDSIGKKIKVVNEISKAIKLGNLTAEHQRAEQIKGQFDFIVSRAVTKMPVFLNWVKGKVSGEHKSSLSNGILYLKGGDLTEEMSMIKQTYDTYSLSKLFDEEFFETKKVIHVTF